MNTATLSEVENAIWERQGRKEGAEIRFLCPCHDDHNPSARWNPDKQVWFCDVCSAGGGITHLARHLEIADIASGRSIVATYDYQDEGGRLLYQVVRYLPKDFRQRRPDGNGGWLWNLKGVQRVLYHLPALRQANKNEWAFVVEGEKDADNLAKLGLLATTNVGGAKKWSQEYTKELTERRVAILPDNDQVGKEHAKQVAESLLDVAAEVKVVELLDLPPGGDVSDWLARGGTKGRLLQLVEAAPIFEPEAKVHPDDDGIPQGDYGHAAVLSRLFKNRYRWATHRGCWMHYDGKVWRPVPEESIAKEAADTLRREYVAQLAAATDSNAIRELSKKVTETCTYARITGALSFLRGWEGVLTLGKEWDRGPWLLNLQNGTLDLQTCTLRPHDPAGLLTKMANAEFDPTARCDHWQQHIERFLPNPNVRRQAQRDLGVALVGATLEEALPIWYGSGANGKTTTASVLMRVLGDYANRTAPNLLVQSKYERHPTEVADLCGLRLVFSVEVDQAKRLAEALVKDLTGGDVKKARHMREDFFSFEQTFSITLIVNHRPVVTGTDVGLWRRIKLIPWEYRIPDNEKRPQEEVVSELVSEGSSILNWLLDGLRDWQQDHHWLATEVQNASDAYRAEMDILGDFIAECCELGPRCQVPKGELYAAYAQWCERNQNERPVCKKVFTSRLEGRGIESRREGDARTRIYIGIGLRTDTDRCSV
ncbi:MAG: phage/plasmid primase, P4 family [Chloroflexi bacterium]|nr:phage/plasmid primase, P4 family [Chloroflexota bacterium]